MKEKYTALLNKAQREGASSVPQMQLCFQILSVASAIDADCAARLSQYSLSEGKFVLLFLLHDHPEGMLPHELSKRAGVTRATVSGLLDGLEKAGLIVRQKNTQDRRSVTVCLTEHGRELISTLFVQHAQWIGGLFEDFSPEERALLHRLLHRVWCNTDAGKCAEPDMAEADGLAGGET